jgi:membrane protease YdiL (CAAX protease family)
MASQTVDQPPELGARTRLLSAVELLLGSAVVVGHNVFRALPNEVPILFVLGLASIRMRDGSLTEMGFRRPASWLRISGIALAAAAVRIALGQFVIDPLTARFWPAAVAPEGTDAIRGNIPYALLALLVVWGFAAFGEEIGYRGYLLTRAADLGGRTTAAYWAGVVVVAVLFGVGHAFKGPAGIVDSGIAGLILGCAYMVSGRYLWTCILAHGFIDTFGVTAVYFGWDA